MGHRVVAPHGQCKALYSGHDQGVHGVQEHQVGDPPYSPDLPIADFWLFPTVKKELAGTTFEALKDVKVG